MSAFPLEEYSDDSVRLNGQISVKRRPSTVIDSEQKSIEQSELSASSSEEFEVIKEKKHFVDIGCEKKQLDIKTLQAKFDASKLDQSWTASWDTCDSITRKSSKYCDNVVEKKQTIASSRQHSDQKERTNTADHQNDSSEVCVRDYSEFFIFFHRELVRATTNNRYNGVVVIGFLSIVVASLVTPIFHSQFLQDREASREHSTKDAIIQEQRLLIEQLRNELESLRKATPDMRNSFVKLAIDEARSTAFQRRDGYDYRLVIMEWKKVDSDGQQSRQHLRLSLKQCNGNLFIYDHGPTSGKLFAVGDRVVDVDGRHFASTVEVKDYILWTFNNRDYFTTIIERPVSEDAKHDVTTCLQPSISSFSTIISTPA
uniref:PDZ domain-containing protein n=1 Tax=Ascaris lumbricoides TaxID=6252 RepID=A0A0M3HN37_ASCLU